MSVSPERGHIIAGVELAGLFVGSPERFEKGVRLHDELELGAADRMADVEHPIFEA
jgi:hypothetical protein